MAKRIRTNHKQALRLWNTGNSDAMLPVLKSLSANDKYKLVQLVKFVPMTEYIFFKATNEIQWTMYNEQKAFS